MLYLLAITACLALVGVGLLSYATGFAHGRTQGQLDEVLDQTRKLDQVLGARERVQ